MKRKQLTKLTALISILLLTAFLLLDWFFPLQLQQTSEYTQVVVAEDGTPLRNFPNKKGNWQYPITINQVSENYLTALLAYEDQYFYSHPGVNPFALLRALWQNTSNGKVVSGGSTLTMQVARIIDPHQRSITGKLKQIFRALQLEWYLTKDEILTIYLNNAPFGGTVIGVEAASYAYLGKSSQYLSDAEAALLTVLPQAPSWFRPDRHPKRAEIARNKVLDRLTQFSLWSEERIKSAKIEPVYTNKLAHHLNAPLLARRLAKPSNSKIQTLIDWQLQVTAETIVKDYVSQLPKKTSAAVLVVENKTMATKAYIGSADFTDSKRLGHVDMINAIRSPGSTLKPFAYGMALDEGLIHSASLLTDAPRLNKHYRPENFSQGFHGPVSATNALKRSLNIPAVQILEYLSPEKFAAQLQNAGLALHFPQQGKPNLSVILGGVGIKLEELVGNYRALAMGGLAAYPRFTIDQPLQQRYLMSSGAAWIVRQMLVDQDNQTTQDYLPLVWKTGTSYGFRDAWAIGVSDHYTIGIWLGRPDGSPMPGYHGRITAVPLLQQIYQLLPYQKPYIKRPQSVSQTSICWPLGTIKSLKENQQHCYQTKRAFVLNDQVPPTLTNPEIIQNPLKLSVLINPTTGKRVSINCTKLPSKRQQVVLWPRELDPWLPKKWQRNQLLPSSDPNCKTVQPILANGVQINSIKDRTLIPAANASQISINLSANGGIGKHLWFINGQLIAETTPKQAFQYEFSKAGKYQISVVDSLGTTDMVAVKVKL
ncbi:penicillin-binding protein 1C [Spartinivicinus ruber]|uniref:penicillin-binding protein 1C n=1 Tax=Spartinivicinus ruber TaxID=2683272 RepID=UPI0013D0DBA9|nr:penicillin-binding protein 1C [Spartinivicinus ruber]